MNNDDRILSEMSEKECIEFIKSRGVIIPDELDNDELGELVKNIISHVEMYPDQDLGFSYNITHEFAESIRKVVKEYYKEN